MTTTPLWRDLERALIEVFLTHHIPFTEDRGERYFKHQGVEYCLSDLAKEMEQRL